MIDGSFDLRVSGTPKSHLAFKSIIPIHKVIKQGHVKPCQNTTSYEGQGRLYRQTDQISVPTLSTFITPFDLY